MTALWSKNLAELWGDRHKGETLLAAGSPFAAKVRVAGLDSLALQWIGPTPTAVDLATIAWYSSVLGPEDPRLTDLVPASNPFWYPEAALVFATNPGNTTQTEMLTVSDNPYGTLLAVITVASDLADFSLLVRGQ